MKGNKIIAIAVIFVFISSSAVSVMGSDFSSKNTEFTNNKIVIHKEFSEPEITEKSDYIQVNVEEANEVIVLDDGPKIPVFTKTVEFPFGTKITDIKFERSNIFKKDISKDLTKIYFQKLEAIKKSNTISPKSFDSSQSEESKWWEITKGVGLNKENKHVLFLSIKVMPVRYKTSEDKIEYIKDVNIEIDYDEPTSLHENNSLVDLLVIAPSEFKSDLIKLVDHKESYGLKTNLTTVEYIYDNYLGRDKPEQIKFFIKEKLDEWNIKYVLLVGSIRKLPIRSTDAYPWEGWGNNILSDLYYADIYDENYSFCSWDSNKNNNFGEADYQYNTWPPKVFNYDNVDLFPDLHIGRLACRNREEVRILVDKIITYEKKTYDQFWFKKIILAGGDTFPPGKMAPFNVFEGEITNEKVAQQLPDFEKVLLWSSKRNLNAFTFNRAINKGAGFLSYAGHGFEHGWGTFRPNYLRDKLGITNPIYYTPFLQGLRNQDKLPIVFFDACLTAKLDYNLSDVENYDPTFVKIINFLTGYKYNPENYLPCFAWAMVSREDGGSIAAVGATRPAYTMVDKEGVYMGAGYLDVHFFKSYYEGITAGEMLTHAQLDYMNNKGKDIFTIEEFILLGDPSLKVGGYP